MHLYSPAYVGNAFIYRASQGKRRLTHLQLQKLVFFFHGWSLAIHGQSSVNERPEAWPYGPAFDSLYHQLKQHGGERVEYMLMMCRQTGERKTLIPSPEETGFWDFLNQVWHAYGRFSPGQLSDLAREKDGPWQVARDSKQGWLDDGVVAAHFQAKMVVNKAKQPQPALPGR